VPHPPPDSSSCAATTGRAILDGVPPASDDIGTVPILRYMYRLIDDVGAGQVPVRNRMYALNALHLLRDAIQDLEGVRSLVSDLTVRRKEIETRQLEDMIFHGPVHDEYHVAARQLRAVVGSGLAQAKRALNQTADVIDAFLEHGTGIRSPVIR
jgi:hypothetical protein